MGESLCRTIKIGMTTRRLFAGSIVALLLSVSSLAAACDLSCTFASLNSDCHSLQDEPQDSASGGMKMDGMAMPGMTMPEMSSGEDQHRLSAATHGNIGHPSIGEMGPCQRRACDNSSAVSTRTNRSVDSYFHSLLAVAESPRANHAPPLFHDAPDDVAFSCPIDGTPLQLTLRI